MGKNKYSTDYTRELGEPKVNCDDINIDVSLLHLHIETLKEFKVEDVLSVVAEEDIVKVKRGETTLGHVPSSNGEAIRNCIEKGTQFHAKILYITETNCKVKITSTNSPL